MVSHLQQWARCLVSPVPCGRYKRFSGHHIASNMMNKTWPSAATVIETTVNGIICCMCHLEPDYLRLTSCRSDLFETQMVKSERDVKQIPNLISRDLSSAEPLLVWELLR